MSDFTYDNSFYFEPASVPAPVPAWDEPAKAEPGLLAHAIALVVTALSYVLPRVLRWVRQ